MVNSNANSIVSLCRKVLRIARYKDDDLKIKVAQDNKSDTVENIKITSKTKYTISYHVIINIIKYLKDFRFIDNYSGTKKGKYEIKDDGCLRAWIDKNI